MRLLKSRFTSKNSKKFSLLDKFVISFKSKIQFCFSSSFGWTYLPEKMRHVQDMKVISISYTLASTFFRRDDLNFWILEETMDDCMCQIALIHA